MIYTHLVSPCPSSAVELNYAISYREKGDVNICGQHVKYAVNQYGI
nr:MAG TPA: hypothetical protein [Caudoviricetes sp.]DAN15362.1 MAG TPA: hypothetical protein [Bacteriophage sp.]